jgi:hypothetical protein
MHPINKSPDIATSTPAIDVTSPRILDKRIFAAIFI